MDGFAPNRILVPISGASTDDSAVRLACRLARRQRARVHVITVIEVERSLPLAAIQDEAMEAAEGLLEHSETVAAELDCEIETDLLQAREAGPAIVDEVREWRADLLVAGVPFRERFDEYYMGTTARYLLHHAPCRTLFFREPAPDEGAA